MSFTIIDTPRAPQAIGPYSQAVRAGNSVFVSGQLPLDPTTGELVEGDVEVAIRRVFENLQAIAEAAGGSLANVAMLTVFLTDFSHFVKVNEIMSEYFTRPYPARAAVAVSQLARGAPIEIECILALN